MSIPITKTDHGILPPNMIPLGFGCGGLLHGGLGQSDSVRLLETAMDCGITYFDTARLYGAGHAEGVLGTLVPSRRDRMIITSKAGILPASRSIPVRALNRGVHLLHRAIPQLKGYITKPAAMDNRLGVFDLPNFRKSIETSLRELRTDYLDILLLHECTETDVKNEELLYFLQNLQKQGKIRAFGLATGIGETIRISKSYPMLSGVIQISSSIWNMNIERLPVMANSLTITHSTLTGRFHELTRRLSSDDLLAKQWASVLQLDPRDKAALARLLLAYALYLNLDGIVLFFSTNPLNIKASVRVATESRITPHQVDGLNALIRNKEVTLPLEEIHRDHLRV